MKRSRLVLPYLPGGQGQECGVCTAGACVPQSWPLQPLSGHGGMGVSMCGRARTPAYVDADVQSSADES